MAIALPRAGPTTAGRVIDNSTPTAIYARLNLDPVRDSMNKATSAIYAASRETGQKNIKKGGRNI